MTKTGLYHGYRGLRAAAVALILAFSLAGTSAQRPGETVAIDNDDIGGIVTGPSGPEAGVWVIAETNDLATGFRRIVVTDDQGRYVVPDLPKANYNVWVRGYGLLDSQKVQSAPGRNLNLTAVKASSAKAAAHYYPANYWFSLLQPPAASEFPGTGQNGNGINENMKNQGQFLRLLKTDSCWSCHQLGNQATREIPKIFGEMSSTDAWARRIQSGQAGGQMAAGLNNLGRNRALKMFADWTDRIAAGELPPAPPRPEGVERNVVITQWDWADPKAYLHDALSSDKRNPRVNPNGPIYGALESSADYMPVVEPTRNASSQVKVTVLDPNTPSTGATPPAQASPYWGDEVIWNSQANIHSLAMDGQGRVWAAARVRPAETPEFCRPGSSHPSAQAFPLDSSGRQLGMWDPKAQKYTPINTCFGTHHLNFAEDADNTLWFCGGGPVVGWFNTKVYDQTKDVAKAQGWTALVLDTNGNGRRDSYVEPDQPVDPTKDKRINAPFYGVSPAPDGSVWGSSTGYPGSVVRLVPGANPPATALAEYYEIPVNAAGVAEKGFSPRGFDVDRNGVAWLALGSGHLASFDRRKCTAPLNGPNATGQHCAEGWTFHQLPGPQLKGVTTAGSAEAPYYAWVDQFDTFGLGPNTPIAVGDGNDAMIAVVNGQVRTFRVPYPMGFYGKGADGRIDNPNAGWKGKGMYSTYATRAPFHSEGGKGTPSKLVKFQIRPNPLAK
jgi:hypothetical protein